jgi:hypothetical protein
MMDLFKKKEVTDLFDTGNSHIKLIDNLNGLKKNITNYEGLIIKDLNVIVPGMAIRIIGEGVKSTYLVDSYANDENINDGIYVRLIDSDPYADVYKWDKNKGKFEMFFTGNPEHLLEVDECDCGEAHSDLDEGDVVFIAQHGLDDPEPFMGPGFDDPTGVYLVSTQPSTFGILDDDEDEELEFISVYALLSFRNEYDQLITDDNLIDFMNNMGENEEED